LVLVFLVGLLWHHLGAVGQFINRRAAMVKLATAVLFVLLAGWLVVALV
jgi:hypothetical protein